MCPLLTSLPPGDQWCDVPGFVATSLLQAINAVMSPALWPPLSSRRWCDVLFFVPTCLLQASNGVMSLALCLQGVSQAPQHFRSSETQAIRESCFSRQSICSVGSWDSSLVKRGTRDRKVVSSNPGRNGGRIFFSRVPFVC